MDLTIGILVVLAIIGYNFSSKREPVKDKRYKVSPNDDPNGDTIYDSTEFKKNRKMEQDKVSDFYKQSLDVRNTNKYTFSSNAVAKQKKLQKTVRFIDEKNVPVKDNSQNIISGPMFNMKMKNDGDVGPVEFNTTEKFTNISKLSDKYVEYTHDNMVPFFGGHPNTVLNNNSNTILSTLTGEKIQHKTEAINTINPAENVYGTPIAKLDKSRYIVSNKLTNQIPFEQKRILPLPQELFRVNEKSADDLRIDTNPKGTFKGRINHGLIGSNRGLQAEVPKNRPSTAYEPNTFFTNAVTKKQPLSNYVDTFRDSSKKQVSEITPSIGGAHSKTILNPTTRISSKNDGISTMYGGDSRHTYANDWVRNTTNQISLRDGHIQETYHAPEQERETTNRMELIGLKGTEAMYRDLDDEAKITNRQNTLYSYAGNVESPTVFAPETRSHYYEVEFKTKPSTSYVPGGTHAHGVGSEYVNIQQKNIKEPENYFGNHATVNPSVANRLNIGENDYKYNASEYNFSSRTPNGNIAI